MLTAIPTRWLHRLRDTAAALLLLADVVARNFFGGQTLTVIAADLGLTLPRVSQIRVRALVLLRAALVHVWEERQPETVGGVRARNEQARNEQARYVASAVEACRAAA